MLRGLRVVSTVQGPPGYLGWPPFTWSQLVSLFLQRDTREDGLIRRQHLVHPERPVAVALALRRHVGEARDVETIANRAGTATAEVVGQRHGVDLLHHGRVLAD